MSLVADQPVSAQSLTEKLIAENPATLARDARKDGNIIRGAILFHQGNIGCVKCHRPSAATAGIGPDLSRIETNVSDEFVVESILQPSKTIKKGFETVIVLTLDGKLTSGSVVSKDQQKVVIRDGQNIDRLVTLQREDIDEIQTGKKSSMPDNLANELKDRQQFLDLLRYVIDIKERGPTSETADATTARRSLSLELAGLVSIRKMNCVACHSATASEPALITSAAPRLDWSAKWLNPDFIEAFIANPHTVKPGTSMPGMMAQSDATTRRKTAAAITQFLVAKSGNEFKFQLIDGEAAHRGFELFNSVGCVACHAPRNESAIEQDLAGSIPLGDLVPQYGVEGLVKFLEDPLAVRPSGHMPNLQLSFREASDIANYLLQSEVENESPWSPHPELVKQGEAFFNQFQCSSCHTDQAPKNAKPIQQVALGKLDPTAGCLSGKLGDWPQYNFDDQEVDSIRAALKQYPVKLSKEQQIDVSLVEFNCIACHNRNDLGGVSPARNRHFQTTNLNLGDQGRMPPTLTHVGAKLKSGWMRDVLVNHRSTRPYMKTRMPQYGESNVGHLVDLFQFTDQMSETKFAEFDDQKETRKTGLELAGNHGLNCVACHTYKFKGADTMPAVDLTEMADRLKKDWFYQYMLAPQKFSPNTVMPSFWPGGQAINKTLPGTPPEQVEALWQYLLDGRQARMPSGVVREPLEIVVTGEAAMLRRNYQGIGKRGIGVGYPGGVNLAYDAEQMRLGMIWNGKFADPGGAWTGQGSGTVRPLGRPINFASGTDLDNQSDPWVVDDGRPPHHQFKGYILDTERRPTFRYTFDSVEVTDFFAEVIAPESMSATLRRTVTLTTSTPRDGLRFRIATGKEVLQETGGVSFIDNRLKIKIVSEHVGNVIEKDGHNHLAIDLGVKPGEEEKIVIEYLLDPQN